MAARGALPVLPEQREVHVVLDHSGRAERLLEAVPHRHVRPARQVRGENDNASVHIDNAGRAGSHRQQAVRRCTCFAHQLANDLRDAAERRRRRKTVRRRDDPMRQTVAAKIRDRQPRPGRPEVDAGNEAVPGVELHQRWTASAARGAGAEVPRQAARGQLGGQRSDRRPRETRGLDQLGAGERSGTRHRDCQQPFERVAPPGRRFQMPPCFSFHHVRRSTSGASARRVYRGGL